MTKKLVLATSLYVLLLFIVFNLVRSSLPVYSLTGASLTHGPIAGATTATTVKIWLRTDQAANVNIAYRQVEVAKWTNTRSYPTSSSSDYATKITLRNLNPDTQYEYIVKVDGIAQTITPNPTFKTFPLTGTSSDFSFVVLADFRASQEEASAHSSTFASASSLNPDFGLIIGDHDHNSPQQLDSKRLMFKGLYDPNSSDMADYVNLVLRKFPLALVWDDHDYGMNNGDKTYANKALSLQVLQEMFPTYPVSAYGDWQFFSYGQADFIMLDRLSQSDPYREPDGPDKSYLDGDNLGSAGQLQWLLNRLKYSKAKWKFVITPTIFNPTPGKPDSWAGYLTERQSILSFITANQIKNVILISADIHFGAIDNGTNSGLPELLVPPVNVQGCVTNPGNNQYQGTWSEGIYGTWIRGTPCWGFAYVEVKSTSNPNTVHLFVKDSDNNTKVSYTVTAQ